VCISCPGPVCFALCLSYVFDVFSHVCFELSVPVQVMAWKNSCQKWNVSRARRKTLLTHSLTHHDHIIKLKCCNTFWILRNRPNWCHLPRFLSGVDALVLDRLLVSQISYIVCCDAYHACRFFHSCIFTPTGPCRYFHSRNSVTPWQTHVHSGLHANTVLSRLSSISPKLHHLVPSVTFICRCYSLGFLVLMLGLWRSDKQRVWHAEVCGIMAGRRWKLRT